jgi:hypothetical protein
MPKNELRQSNAAAGRSRYGPRGECSDDGALGDAHHLLPASRGFMFHRPVPPRGEIRLCMTRVKSKERLNKCRPRRCVPQREAR